MRAFTPIASAAITVKTLSTRHIVICFSSRMNNFETSRCSDSRTGQMEEAFDCARRPHRCRPMIIQAIKIIIIPTTARRPLQ